MTLFSILFLLLVVFFKRFLSYFHFIIISLVYQVVISLYIFKFSMIMILTLEILLVSIVFWFSSEGSLVRSKGWTLYLIYLTLSISLISISLYIDLFYGFFSSIHILFFLIILKLFISTLLTLCDLEGGYNQPTSSKLYLPYYFLSLKLFIFYYGFLINKHCLMLSYLFDLVYSPLGLFFITFIWMIFISVSCFMLANSDFFSYVLSSLNLSQLLLLISAFLSFKVFLFYLFIDLILFLILYYYVLLGSGNIIFKSSYKSIIVFLVMSMLFGIPPLPSFYIEVNLLFLGYLSFNPLFKFIYFIFIYLIVLINVIVFLIFIISKDSNQYYGIKDSREVHCLALIFQVYFFLWIHLIYSSNLFFI